MVAPVRRRTPIRRIHHNVAADKVVAFHIISWSRMNTHLAYDLCTPGGTQAHRVKIQGEKKTYPLANNESIFIIFLLDVVIKQWHLSLPSLELRATGPMAAQHLHRSLCVIHAEMIRGTENQSK
jgi:hypothetical protein